MFKGTRRDHEVETRRLLSAMYGIETEGVGLETYIDKAWKAKRAPMAAAKSIGKHFKLRTLQAWDESQKGEP